MTRLQKLAVASAVTTVVLFSVGGLVRGTGSGLGCSAWPACEPGRLFPTGALHSLIEFSHRAVAFVAIVLIGITALQVWRERRDDPAVLIPALAAVPLVLAQAALGGIVVISGNDPWWVTAHFVIAMALIADVVVLAVNALRGDAADERGGADRAFARLAATTAAVTGLLLLVGTYVRASNSQLVFTDWPLMDGRLVPALGGAATVMFVHRVLAASTFLLVIWTAIRVRTIATRSRDLVRLSTLALVLFVGQIFSGAANVWTRLRPWAVVLHVALSVLIWATLVVLAALSRLLATRQRDAGPAAPEGTADPGRGDLRETIGAYVRLTKPRIVVLLLITTVPAMILASGGLPSLWLILATLVGGSIAAGSANAVNMYLDRDIDEIMRRTRGRPLPAHLVTPDRALAFGFVLGAVSYLFLAIAVNVLAATLALSAIAFYVFVYTMWLKRTTTQNIVIGGAAGAVPALVGWAAVTGTVAAPAWILFAIIFVWTPPHFWALSMRYRQDYAAAGVPMLPVVRGEDETRRQIFLYSLVLFGTTLLLVPIARMGPVYLATAIVLGGVFVFRALRLWRDPAPARAWGLFKYSIVYLAALFGSVAVDALTPLGRRAG
ncbi:MAG: heme o synthase [Actinomycetota bacterium]|nr:heme o synthase [Actinomycetota bacterium]